MGILPTQQSNKLRKLKCTKSKVHTRREEEVATHRYLMTRNCNACNMTMTFKALLLIDRNRKAVFKHNLRRVDSPQINTILEHLKIRIIYTQI